MNQEDCCNTIVRKKHYAVGLSIAGSDPSGGAGIQADIKTFSALGVYGAAVITALTIQNTVGVQYVHPVPPQVVYDQIVAVMSDIRPSVVKVGMVNDVLTLKAIVTALRQYKPSFLIVDPVIMSSSGKQLMSDDAMALLINDMLPVTDLLTPNIPEAKRLTDNNDLSGAAITLLEYGVKAVLIKGGHSMDKDKTDILFRKTENGIVTDSYTSSSVNSNNTHGTGCTLSTAIASFLARGCDICHAIEKAKHYITEALKAGAEVETGKGTGPLNHFFDPEPLIIKDYE